MPLTSDLMGLGLAPALAQRLGLNPTSVSGVGTTQTSGSVLNSYLNYITPTAGNTAFTLGTIPLGTLVYVINVSTTVAAVLYPPSGGTINGQSANTSVTLPPNMALDLVQLTNGQFVTDFLPGFNIDPASQLTYFGGGTGTFPDEGNIYRNVVAGTNPGGTGSDYVLASYTLPAGSFDVSGRGINLISQGSVANNTNTKTIKLWYNCTTATVGSVVTGGTTIATTGAYNTTGAAGWALEANVFKYGVNGSNTQLALHVSAQVNNTVEPLLVPTAVTATESGPIILAVTGNAATTATDIIYNFFEINAMN